MAAQKILNDFLVLLSGERTGGIDQYAAELQAGADAVEKLFLQSAEALDVRFNLEPLRLGMRAERAQAGARKIRQDAIVRQRELSRQLARRVGEERTDRAESETLHVFLNARDAARGNVGGDDLAAIVHQLGEMRRFA